jgi:hypothetical protein
MHNINVAIIAAMPEELECITHFSQQATFELIKL